MSGGKQKVRLKKSLKQIRAQLTPIWNAKYTMEAVSVMKITPCISRRKFLARTIFLIVSQKRRPISTIENIITEQWKLNGLSDHFDHKIRIECSISRLG